MLDEPPRQQESAESCRQLCAQTAGCEHFSFHSPPQARRGLCQLQDGFAAAVDKAV
eukprot:CAMPEP_0115156760 /NCGR_PEP_ID=MMETSP0227-20121206/68643_1 /TAXON_ID=89957 /ORGANISM="Polarella glacialis, Strain CCMP 1383" /LENGTH=55 /DNA_ID=CAMNT_0002568011 /DNA_START=60 /DNA_END=224 /DNA_ORIENTATION=+